MPACPSEPASPAPTAPPSGSAPDPHGQLALQLEALAARLAGPRDVEGLPRPGLPRVYGWLITAGGRRRVKCLLDSGASHCFLSRALAAQLPAACRRPQPAGHPLSVTQADGSSRPTGGAVSARLVLGGLDEETAFVEYDVDCDADIIRTNPADFLTRKRFPDGPGPAPHMGYAEPDSAVELLTASGAASTFVAAGHSAESPRFLHPDVAAAIRAALPSDPVLGPSRRQRRRRSPARGRPRHAVRGGDSLVARLRLAGRATLPSQPARRPPLRARRASDTGAARVASHSVARVLWT